jgi:hypothetical protein
VLEMVGGLSGHERIPGTLTAVSSTGESCSALVDNSGVFALFLVPGTYQITGHSPNYNGGSSPCSTRGPVVVPLQGGNNPFSSIVVVDCQRR